MKNLQKGFVVPTIITIITVLAIGGVYVYKNHKIKTPTIVGNEALQKNIEITTTGSSVKPIDIFSPSFSNVLESGKSTSVTFSAIENAVSYESTISHPNKGVLVSLKSVTSNPKLNIVVPQTDATFLGENSYDGYEELSVQAYDKNGNLVGSGKTQVRILPPPSQPNLLKADKYVVSGDGDEVILTFGILSGQFVKREVDVSCVNTYTVASMDNEPCEKKITLGVGPYTKKLSIKKNIFKDRETSIIVGVRYYDFNNQEQNPSDIDDQSFVSIKISKPSSTHGSSAEETKPILSHVAQLQNEEKENIKNCPSAGLKFFNTFVANNGQFPNTTNFNFDKVIGEPQYHYNKSISACLIKLTHTISPLSDTVFVSRIMDVHSTKLLTHSVWASNKDLGERPTKEEFDEEARNLMSE
jgi:hypothetical protein